MNFRAAFICTTIITLSSSAVAQPAQRFNLNCTNAAGWASYDGKITERTLEPKGLDAPFVLRIDLVSKTWCRVDMCSRVGSLTADPNAIRLSEERDAIFIPKEFVINRMTGKFTKSDYMGHDGGAMANLVGSCKLAPFTPFPKAMF
ncbi:MAG: hypothetical protein V4597_08130 [Pseudomonadota bacterium]